MNHIVDCPQKIDLKNLTIGVSFIWGFSLANSVIRVIAYEQFDDKGFICFYKNEIYTFELKFHVVELYLITEITYEEPFFVV